MYIDDSHRDAETSQRHSSSIFQLQMNIVHTIFAVPLPSMENTNRPSSYDVNLNRNFGPINISFTFLPSRNFMNKGIRIVLELPHPMRCSLRKIETIHSSDNM